MALIQELQKYAENKVEVTKISLHLDKDRAKKVQYLKKTSGIPVTADLLRALIDSGYQEALRENSELYETNLETKKQELSNEQSN